MMPPVFEGLVWLVPLAVIATGIARPRAALVALAASLPLFGASRGGPYQPALDIACLAAVLLCLRERRPERTSLDLAVLAFTAAGVASFFPVAYHPPSWQPRVLVGLAHALANAQAWAGLFTWRALLDLLVGCGLYFSTRRAFSDRSVRPLALGLAGGLAVLLVLGLAEQAGAIDLGGYRTIAAEGRLHALFSNSGWLGQYVVIASPLAVGALASTGRRGRVAGALLGLLCLAAVLLSQQRGAWLALLVQGALGLALLGPGRWREPRARRAGFAVSLVIVAGAGLVAVSRPGLVSDLAGRATSPDLLQRPHLWRAAARLCLQRPALGWGIGSFEPALGQRAPVSEVRREAQGEAHSTPLHLAAERGLAGLLGLGLLVVAAVAVVREGLRRDADPPMAVGRTLALAGAATYGLVQYVWYLPAVGLLVWMVLGIGSARGEVPAERLVRRVAPVLVGLGGLLVAWRVVAVEPLRPPDDRSYGFHQQEVAEGRTFQWTEGRAARRLACSGHWLILELANGHPDGAKRPVEVTVRVDGRRVAVRDVRGGWQASTVPIGDACDDGTAVVEILARPTFRPFSDLRGNPARPAPRDERELGVAVRVLRVD
jgi:O-antigen ligase